MIFKGFRFGMLLQLAVGPMCLLVFTTSTTHGFLVGLSLVFAITIIDALYISLSGIGIGAIIGKDRIKHIFKIFGGAIMVVFGVNTLLGVFDLSIIPSIFQVDDLNSQNIFIQGLFLTASNPLTILFWSGVFSAQVVENNLKKKQLFFFGLGCVLSTIAFLVFIAIMGSVLGVFLPPIVMKLLNIFVGFALIFFGIKLLTKKI